MTQVEYDTKSYAAKLINSIIAENLSADHYTWHSPKNPSSKPELPLVIQKAVLSVVSLNLRGRAETIKSVEHKIQAHFSSRKASVSSVHYEFDKCPYHLHSASPLLFQYLRKINKGQQKKKKNKDTDKAAAKDDTNNGEEEEHANEAEAQPIDDGKDSSLDINSPAAFSKTQSTSLPAPSPLSLSRTSTAAGGNTWPKPRRDGEQTDEEDLFATDDDSSWDAGSYDINGDDDYCVQRSPSED